MKYPGIYFFSERILHYNEGYIILDFLWDLKISTFVVMVAIAFLLGYHLLKREFQRNKVDEKLADTILLIAIAGGFFGAKIFGMLENWHHFKNSSQAWYSLSAPGGLTWYGGLIAVVILFFAVMRKQNYSAFRILDLATPILALSYGLGRLGCLFSGDGCYGSLCTNLPIPFCMDFSLGSDQYSWQQIVIQAKAAGVQALVYNTPLFDFLVSMFLFGFFWKLRQKSLPLGKKFFIYLLAHAGYRFAIEYIRLNEAVLGRFTQAQLVSLILLTVCVAFFCCYRYLKFKPEPVVD